MSEHSLMGMRWRMRQSIPSLTKDTSRRFESLNLMDALPSFSNNGLDFRSRMWSVFEVFFSLNPAIDALKDSDRMDVVSLDIMGRENSLSQVFAGAYRNKNAAARAEHTRRQDEDTRRDFVVSGRRGSRVSRISRLLHGTGFQSCRGANTESKVRPRFFHSRSSDIRIHFKFARIV